MHCIFEKVLYRTEFVEQLEGIELQMLYLSRNLLAYIYIPVLQKELDTFRVSVWNNHRMRKQRDKELRTGVPEHIYHYPDEYGGERCGLALTDEQLQEVAEVSSVLDGTNAYLDEAFRNECERHVPNTDDIEPSQVANAYLYLKANFDDTKM